eukprot:c8409_g2_i1.p1 GENE.c8409_g2_i1~~c8409_g2_i1.p1  ORF type:complete len:313 (+),score=73.70 c8409_g2_i1:36-974(+)
MKFVFFLVAVGVVVGVPIDPATEDAINANPRIQGIPRSIVQKNNATAANFNPMNLISQFCQSSGAVDQCGAGNCETWSTGDVSAGSNPGRIYCNDQGLFCSGSSCYYPCMDKSPDTQVLGFTYLPPTSAEPVPEAVFVHYIDNFLNSSVDGNFQWQESVQTQYQWSWETTSSVSVSLSSKVGLPDICSVEDSVTTTVSTTEGQSQTNTNTKTWGAQQNYQVPPQSTLKLTYIVSKTKFTVPYQQTVQFGAQVAFWCSNAVNGHHFWMPDSGDIMQMSPSCNGNICTFFGTFTGIQGVSDVTSYQSCPLGVHC